MLIFFFFENFAGFLGALTACLKEIADNHKSDEILVIVLKLVDLNCTIINGMMDIMAKESSDGKNCN